MVERKGRIWAEKKTPEQTRNSPKSAVKSIPPADAELLRGFDQPNPPSHTCKKSEADQNSAGDAGSSLDQKSFSVGPEEHHLEQLGDKNSIKSKQSVPVKIGYRGAAPPEITVPVISLDTSYESSLGDGPVSPLEEDNVYFMGDEVGELALGLGDGGEYCDAVWSFDQEENVIEDRNHRKHKNDIRRNISQSITPRNNSNNSASTVSPRGLDAELEVAILWNEQQQLYRKQSFHQRNIHSKTKQKSGDFLPTNSSLFVEPPSPSRQVVWRHNRSTNNEMVSPSSGLNVITGIWNEDLDEEYPDTPSRASYKGNCVFESLNLPEMLERTKSSKPVEGSENEYEVKTSLPMPDLSWYKDFFESGGKSTARQLDTFSTKASSNGLKESTSMISRLSRVGFYTADKRTGPRSPMQQRLASENKKAARPALEEVFTEEELLAFAGYKDFGNGLAEC